MRASRFLKTLTAAGLLLAGASGALAQETKPAARPKATPPQPAPVKEVRFPEFQQKTLANGLRVVVIEQHEQPAVSLRLVVNGGRTFEPQGKAGLAQATAALLTQGTKTRSAQQIAETIDFVGGTLGATSALQSGFVTANVTSDQLDLGFELLADVVLNPSFPQEELDRWRRQALSGLQVQLQDAGYLADTALVRALYGDHPYGRPAAGTPESLQGLTRDDLVRFHKERFIPNDNAILAVVGDVRAEDAFARAERALGQWQKGQPATYPKVNAQLPEKRKIIVIDKPDAVQTEVRLGQIALPYRDPDHFAAEVYNVVLGGTPSARLFDEIRRKRGLSYGATSGFLMADLPGWFQAGTSTKTESTLEALNVALDVVRNLEKQPVPAAELTNAKTYVTGAFPLEIETSAGIATKVLEAMRFGYDREFLETYNQKISAVSAADIQRFAQQRMEPDKMTIVLAGNASAFSEELKKKVGDFELIPAAEVDFLQADLRKAKAAAAAPASSADQARALDILRKAQQALGGKAFAEQKTQVVKGSGTLNMPGAPQPMQVTSLTIYSVMPDKERTELTLPMGNMVQVQTGQTGWMSFGPQVQDLPAQMGQQQFYGYDLLRNVGKDGYTARPLPDATVDGKALKVAEMADAEGRATRFFVDPASSLVAKVEYTAGAPTEVFLSDYRDVSGVKVPFKTRVVQGGNPMMEITYSDVQVNAPVDDKLFQKPQPQG